MAVDHDAQDGRDAATRRRLDYNKRKPIRFDLDTWLVMRDDPVLPAALIRRIRHRGGESFLVLSWDLEPTKLLMTGRFPSLQDADESIRYQNVGPVIPRPGESAVELQRRHQEHERQQEQVRARAAEKYGP